MKIYNTNQYIEKLKINPASVSCFDRIDELKNKKINYKKLPIREIENKEDFKNYLIENEIWFENYYDEKDKFDVFKVKTNYNDAYVVYEFIGTVEYLYNIYKGDKMIYYMQSSKEIDWSSRHTDKNFLRLDPVKLFKDCIKTSEKRVKKVKSFYDSEIEKRKIEKYKNLISIIEQ